MSPTSSQAERWLMKAGNSSGGSRDRDDRRERSRAPPRNEPDSVMSSRSVRSADPEASFRHAENMMGQTTRGFTPPSDHNRRSREREAYSRYDDNVENEPVDTVAASMIERFGNPQIDDVPRRSMHRSRPAAVPTHTPIVWDTPHEALAGDGTPNRFFNRGNERLYEAYSQLHSMAQEFDKPFDSPAILVVGHQTDGKSALVEALMGFQFNHVGGGTKTRRPIAINMKYNPTCVEPRCFLLKDDSYGREEEMTLPDLQRYIESENQRLENDNGFWAKDIVVKIEYKFCPNLTIIDTPGLIAAAPGRKHSGIQSASRSVEALVRGKMEQKDYIILCLEDNSDWNNATTRRVVLDCDPELRRTVVVSTKFDTRIPQFSRASDVEMFMKPSARLLEPTLLGGGPFFTSVPSGRVGGGRDCLFRSNESYREAVVQQEQRDTKELERRMDRRLQSNERSRVGVSQLRHFLERLLQQRYLENVPTIVPVLEREHRAASGKLNETVLELENLDTDKLKEKGRAFYQHFLEKIPELLRGTMAAPPRVFGETLAHEHIRGGAFVGPDGAPNNSVAAEVPNGDMRLFGGAQYHRALEEFRATVANVQCPVVSREDIINSCGVDEVHDGVNYTRTACVIAVARARDTFEPFIHQLGFRLAHIARRLLPVAMYLLQKEGRILTGHEAFLKRIGSCFAKFVDEKVKACQEMCREDLKSTTSFVTWSLHSGNRSGLASVLRPENVSRAQEEEAERKQARAGEYPDRRSPPRGRDSRYDDDHAYDGMGGVDYPDENGRASDGRNRDGRNGRREESRRGYDERGKGKGGALVPVPDEKMGSTKMMDLMDNTLWNRNMKDVTLDVVDLLVRQIYAGIRGYTVQSVELKFNCFFLMPLMNEFAGFLRQEMEMAFDDNLDGVFDVRSVRMALEERQRKLESELGQMEHIQEKFASIHNQLEVQAQGSPATAAAASAAVTGNSFSSAAEREMEASAAAMRASQEMAAELKQANQQFSHHSPGKPLGKTYGSPPATGKTRMPLSGISGNN